MIENTWPTIKRISSKDQAVLKFVYQKDTAVAESVLYKYRNYMIFGYHIFV